MAAGEYQILIPTSQPGLELSQRLGDEPSEDCLLALDILHDEQRMGGMYVRRYTETGATEISLQEDNKQLLLDQHEQW